MFEGELTINAVLSDPPIPLVKRAGGISNVRVHSLLNDAREWQLTHVWQHPRVLEKTVEGRQLSKILRRNKT